MPIRRGKSGKYVFSQSSSSYYLPTIFSLFPNFFFKFNFSSSLNHFLFRRHTLNVYLSLLITPKLRISLSLSESLSLMAMPLDLNLNYYFFCFYDLAFSSSSSHARVSMVLFSAPRHTWTLLLTCFTLLPWPTNTLLARLVFSCLLWSLLFLLLVEPLMLLMVIYIYIF